MNRVALSGLACALAAGCAAQRLSVPIVPPLISPPKAAVLWAERFDALDPGAWREVEVHGRTRYDIVRLEDRVCLRATSEDSASILLHAIRYDPDDTEWLSWIWRVDEPVAGEALETKPGSDAAARVYVYFETSGLPWQKRSLDYVWSSREPEGRVFPSAFSSGSKIIVAESGPGGHWRFEERNIEADYRMAFGEDPPRVAAIGIMTDADNSGGRAVAHYDDVRVSREPLLPLRRHSGKGNAP